LAKNYDFIEAVGDAWTLGLSRDFLIRGALKSLLRPRRFLGYLHRGIQSTYANVPTSKHTRAVNLPKPTFRYWCVTLSGFCRKLRRHKEMFKDFDYGVLGEEPKTFSSAVNFLKKYVLRTTWTSIVSIKLFRGAFGRTPAYYERSVAERRLLHQRQGEGVDQKGLNSYETSRAMAFLRRPPVQKTKLMTWFPRSTFRRQRLKCQGSLLRIVCTYIVESM